MLLLNRKILNQLNFHKREGLTYKELFICASIKENA